ncbi:MAG: hypothetical protein M0R06_21370 [Sphaerochaeta sp.]|jgi:hypothetical protein|nr:hypothetical protein [Dehalococcoidia bacterium]MCK9601606.1 hypothetical protein [Sphaerochaeta sp.]
MARIYQKAQKGKWVNIIVRTNATMATEKHDEVIAKFTHSGDAYMWACEIAKRFDDNHLIILQ